MEPLHADMHPTPPKSVGNISASKTINEQIMDKGELEDCSKQKTINVTV